MCDWLLAGRETERVLINVSKTLQCSSRGHKLVVWLWSYSGYRKCSAVWTTTFGVIRDNSRLLSGPLNLTLWRQVTVFKTTCNCANVCMICFTLQLQCCTTLNLCRTSLFFLSLLFVLLVCIRDKLKQKRDVYLQLMEDFGDEPMTRSGTAAFLWAGRPSCHLHSLAIHILQHHR